MTLERRRFQYDIESDPDPERTISDSLDTAGDYWNLEASARLRLLEQDLGIIKPVEQRKTVALIGGLVDFLQNKYDIEADDLVISNAVELIRDNISEEFHGACVTQLAVALADKDRFDAAISMLPDEGGPVPEEYEYFVHLALAEAHARRDGNESITDPAILEELLVAFVCGADVAGNAEYYEKVLNTAVKTRSC